MRRKFVTIAACLATIALAPVRAHDSPGQMGGGMMHGEQKMQMHQEMDKQRQAQDEELGKLLDEMNSAPADQKLNAAAAVINKLVQQRKAMHELMREKHEQATSESKESAMQCCRMMQSTAKSSDQPTTTSSSQPAATSSTATNSDQPADEHSSHHR
jgi:hypothetical protein